MASPKSSVLFAAVLAVPAALLAQEPGQIEAPTPPTVAEASAWTKTSTHDEVLALLRELRSLPHADRLSTASLGSSGEGRDLAVMVAAQPACEGPAAVLGSGKLRILINANIHAGEVEGKTAVQMLLREIAHGEHAALLEGAVLVFVPDFNPDGNDRISADNRASQNGPTGGVGTRPNAADLDLNRDFIKAESPEVRGMLGAFRSYDPHLFLDLHTTNGSTHGYHLTYAPSLSTNVDPALDDFARGTLLPEVRRAVADGHGFRIYDYGNFSRREPRQWSTYDHRPRFGTNYYGLRNRLSLLSEAYSYVDFEQRVRATRAFVLESIAAAIRHRSAIEKLCAQADRRLLDGDAVRFGYATELAPAVEGEVLVGSVRRDGKRVIAESSFEAVRMPVQVAFESKAGTPLPAAWVIAEPSDEVRANLLAHGLRVERIVEPVRAEVEMFVPTEVRRERRPFQGHRTVEVAGELERREVSLPAGGLVVPARQRLARVAAQLLEARSEDSLATWNYFDGQIADPGAADRSEGSWPFPVARLTAVPAGIKTEVITTESR